MTFWDGTRWVPDPQVAPPKPRHRVARHVFGAVAEGALITALVFGLIAGSAFAAKGGNSGKSTPHTASGSCSVLPDPVAVGDPYVITVTGLSPNHFVDVDVATQIGVTGFMRYTDSSGSTSVSATAQVPGTSDVSVWDTSRHKPALVASCSFAVQ
jgi:hypothetical protein